MISALQGTNVRRKALSPPLQKEKKAIKKVRWELEGGGEGGRPRGTERQKRRTARRLKLQLRAVMVARSGLQLRVPQAAWVPLPTRQS